MKMDAKKAQIAVLVGGVGKCAKSKNPSKCKLKVQNKIKKLQAKLGR